MPKYVVSTTSGKLEWNNSRVLKGGIDGVAELKKQVDRDILVFGSLSLAMGLIQRHLVDELRIEVYPIIVGEGKRLFNGGANMPFQLIDSRVFDNGAVLLRYKQADFPSADSSPSQE